MHQYWTYRLFLLLVPFLVPVLVLFLFQVLHRHIIYGQNYLEHDFLIFIPKYNVLKVRICVCATVYGKLWWWMVLWVEVSRREWVRENLNSTFFLENHKSKREKFFWWRKNDLLNNVDYLNFEGNIMFLMLPFFKLFFLNIYFFILSVF